MQSFSDS